jgi:hypothetical protein
VALELAHDRLLELADWWRQQAQALVREPRTFQEPSGEPTPPQIPRAC